MKRITCIFLSTLIILLSTSFSLAEGTSTNGNATIYYPNGDWMYEPMTLSIPSDVDNPALFAIQALVNGVNLPPNCYNEIPEGTVIRSLKTDGNTAYIDIDDSIISKIDNQTYAADMIQNIISYNIFKLTSASEINFTFSGKSFDKFMEKSASEFFSIPKKPAEMPSISKNLETIKKQFEGMNKKEIIEVLKQKKLEKSLIDNALIDATADYDPTVTKICVDPGHGGTDPGTHGTYGGTTYYEDDLNLIIALILRDYLEDYGYTVYMTRTTDTTVSLTSRYTLANNNDVDCFVSVHLNGVESTSPHGTTCIYPNNHDIDYSQDLALWVHNFVTTFDFDEYRTPYTDERNLAVLRNTQMPAIITETGFMTNSNDMAHLADSSNQDSIAEDIYVGIAMWDMYGEY